MEKDHLHNRLVREIIARVAAGSYTAGGRLPAERDLCSEFQVARGTLRRALRQLKELGVLTVKPNSGIYVRGLPRSALPKSVLPPDLRRINLHDVIEARKAIETAAFRQATRRITGREIRQLRQLVDRMAAAVDDLPAFLELDLAFHQAVVRASGNAVLRTAHEAIRNYHRFSAVYTSRSEGDEREALDYHRKWLAALERGDVAAGTRILGRHLDAIVRHDKRPIRRKTDSSDGSRQREDS